MKIKTSTATIQKIDGEIIEAIYDNDIVENLETVKENFDACIKLAGGKEYLLLIETSKIVFADGDAREFSSNSDYAKRYLKKVAVISQTYVGSALAKLFLSVNKPLYPFKVFKSREKAIRWLKRNCK